MTTASPQGYSRLFATGLFLSTDLPSTSGSGSRSVIPTHIPTTPRTQILDSAPRHAYSGSATLIVPSYNRSSGATRRPKLTALRTHSTWAAPSMGPSSATTPTSASVPSSPRMLRRRRSSLTMAHNPMTPIKSPTRSAGMSGRTQSFIQALGSPVKERRTWSLDVVGEQSFEGIKSDAENTPTGTKSSKSRPRRAVVARKPPPTVPLPIPPTQPALLLPPTLTLNINFSSPNLLSPALTPSPNILPAPTPGAVELGLHKFTFPNHRLAPSRPARSPLVASVNNIDLEYFDTSIRMSSPVLPENEMDVA